MKKSIEKRNVNLNAANNKVFKPLGASNHCKEERQKDDYYATTPKAAELLLQEEEFSPQIWECACGEGHLSKVFLKEGYNVKSTDLIDRGFGESGIDFLACSDSTWEGDIITNPPYKLAKEFVAKALSIIPDGKKVAMFLKLQFLEGKSRKAFFVSHPPKVVYVSSSRLWSAKDGDFEKLKSNGGSAVAYAWYVWEKGYKGTTQLVWIN